MGDINKINVSLLKSFNRDFKNEMNNFNNKAYGTFSNSYLNRCSDPIIVKMKNSLNGHYDKIKKGYKNIDSWWNDYTSNIESVENYLSGSGGIEQIQEPSVKAAAGALPLLNARTSNIKGSFNKTKRKTDTAKMNNRNVSSTKSSFNENVLGNNLQTDTNGVHSWMKSIASDLEKFATSTGAAIGSATSSLRSSLESWSNKASLWWEKEAVPTLGIAQKNISTVVNKTGATVVNGAQSLVEGVAKFGETVVDTGALAGTALASVATGLYDGGKAISSAITGNDWDSTTKKMWDKTSCFVKEDYVTTFFDDVYDNTSYGRWLNENALAKDTVRSVGNGIGYVSGVVALSLATGGLGGTLTTGANGGMQASSLTMAGVSGTLGIAKGSEKAWANGATTLEGLGAGALTGLWEGTQFYVGGKINMTNIVGNMGVKNQVINGLARVSLDSVDSGLEGFMEPLIGTIYKKGYYDESGQYVEYFDNQSFASKYAHNFSENGGWGAVATNALIGGGMSFLSETSAFIKSTHNEHTIKNVQNSIDRFNELENLKNSKKYCEELSMAERQEVDLEYEQLKTRIASFKKDLKIKANTDDLQNIDADTLQLNDTLVDTVDYNDIPFKTLSKEEIYEKNKLLFDRIQNEVYENNEKRALSKIELLMKTEELKFLADSLPNLERFADDMDDETLKIILSDYELSETYVKSALRVKKLSEEIRCGKGDISLQESTLLKEKLANQKANIELKSCLLKSVQDIENPILKARKLYWELSKKLHYDLEYTRSSKTVQSMIYDSFTSFEDINSNHTVICKGWSELYKEILIEAGFSEESVRIIGPSGFGAHRWVEIDVGSGKHLIADATEKINGSLDLSAVKSGYATNGFLLVDDLFVGKRISTLYKQATDETKKQLAELQKEITDLDVKLGYATKDGYLVDRLTKSKKMFGDNMLTKKLFGSIKEIDLVKKIVNYDIPSSLDGMEAIYYFKNIISNNPKLSDMKDLKVKLGNTRINGIYETVCQLEYFSEIGEEMYAVYSEKLGKHIFNNFKEYKIFLNSKEIA